MATESLVETEDLSALVPASRELAIDYLAGRQAEASRRAAISDLRQVARALGLGDWQEVPWTGIRSRHVEMIRAKLLETRSTSTVNRQLVTLKGVLKAAYLDGFMNGRDWLKIQEVKRVRGHREPKGRRLTKKELRKLFRALMTNPTGRSIRDAAVFALMFGLGLRRSEVVDLVLGDYDAEGGGWLLVMGKGRKERRLPINGGVGIYLDRWLGVRGDWDGSLFCQFLKGGEMTREPLGKMAVYKAVRYWAERAGVKPFTPHDARRSFVSGLLENGADLSTTANLAGHSNVQTTRRYDVRGAEAMRKASDLVQLPLVQPITRRRYRRRKRGT